MWTEENNALVAHLEFDDFVTAFGFMTSAAMLAERSNHHPEWTNVYNRLSITLTTHDVGNIITQKDRDLAQAFEDLYNRTVTSAKTKSK